MTKCLPNDIMLISAGVKFMNNEIIFYIEESYDGGFEAWALGYPIFTDGETIDELKSNIKDAIHCHFE